MEVYKVGSVADLLSKQEKYSKKSSSQVKYQDFENSLLKKRKERQDLSFQGRLVKESKLRSFLTQNPAKKARRSWPVDDDLEATSSNSEEEEEEDMESDSEVELKGKEESADRTELRMEEESDGEDSDDISDSEQDTRKAKKKIRDPPDRMDRTIFIGNVPLTVDKQKLNNFFSRFGKVESLRFRCIPVADPRKPIIDSFVNREFHKERTSMVAYVNFANKESADKALVANGALLEGHHLRVDRAYKEAHFDHKRAIFVGNVPFAAEDDELWEIFKECGPIESVRIVRDRRTNVGKGFAYVNFKNSDSVELALKLGDTKLRGRILRIKRAGKSSSKKRMKKPSNRGVPGEAARNFNWKQLSQKKLNPQQKKNAPATVKENRNPFQGQTTDDASSKLKKKKKKKNKEEKKKQRIAELLGKNYNPQQ